MWDEGCDYTAVREIRVKTTAYLGVGAIDKIDEILGQLKSEGVNSLLCCDRRTLLQAHRSLGQSGGRCRQTPDQTCAV